MGGRNGFCGRCHLQRAAPSLYNAALILTCLDDLYTGFYTRSSGSGSRLASVQSGVDATVVRAITRVRARRDNATPTTLNSSSIGPGDVLAFLEMWVACSIMSGVMDRREEQADA